MSDYKARRLSDAAALRSKPERQPVQKLGRLMSPAVSSAARWCASALLAMACAAAQAEPERLTKGGIDYFVDAAPTWVSRTNVRRTDPAPALDASPLRHVLLDYQVSLLAATPQRYLHHALLAATASAVAQVANVSIAFSPDYERLTLHALTVLRGDHRIDKLSTARVEILRRELEREASVYNGVVTLDFVLDDVRAGDLIEVEYTVSGTNAVGGERFNQTFRLAMTEPVDTMTLRVLSPVHRPLYHSVLHADVEPQIKRLGNVSELTLRRENVPAIDLEPSTPVEDAPVARLRLSEYQSWAEVGAWADALYRLPEDLSPELRRTIDDIRARSSSGADAVRRALKIVQTEIRYVGVEIGQSSYRPTHPNQVLERRYGDCKDKALLLSTIVRALGYKAQPALVSNSVGRDASGVLPMVRVFDHMIVRVEVDGQTYWLDATRTFQEGTLDRIGNPRFHWALVTGNASRALTAMSNGAQYQQRMDSRFDLTIKDYRKPVELKWTATYMGIAAEAARAAYATQDHRKLAEQDLSELRRWYPGANAAGDITINDDTDTNTLTVTQPLTVRDFFEDRAGVDVGRLYAIWIRSFAESPAKLERVAPFAQVYPFTVHSSFVVDFPEDIKLRVASPVSLSDDNLDFAVGATYDNKRLRVDYKLSTRREVVPPKDMAMYADTLRKVRDRLAYQFPIQAARTTRGQSDDPIGLRVSNNPSGLRASVSSEDRASQIGNADRALNASVAQTPPPEPVSVAEALLAETEEEERRISKEIASGRLGKRQLHSAYLSRAWAREHQARYDDALADSRRALELDPNDGRALETLAFELGMLGRFDEALRQYEQAEPLLQDDVGLLMGRGRLNYYSGHLAQAQADFRRARTVAEKDDDTYQHALIWLYLASARAGGDPKAEVQPYLGARDESWPAPALKLLTGDIDVKALYESARHADEKIALKQSCEAHFFVGQYYLLKGDVDQANRAFEQAIGTDLREYVEYVYAKWELQRTASR